MWIVGLILCLKVAPAAPIDLAEALRIAQERGLDPKTAAWAVASAESTLDARRRAGQPDLQLSANAGAGWSPGSLSPSARVGLSSTTPVYAGGELATDREVAAALYTASLAEQRRVFLDLRYTLADALLDLGEAQAREALSVELRSAEEALLERVQLLVGAGARTEADLRLQEAALARVVAEQAEATRLAARARLVLVQLLRLSPREEWEFVAPVNAPAPEGGLDVLILQAAAAVPELQALEQERLAAEATLRGARAGRLPSVNLGVDAGVGWTVEEARPDAGVSLGLAWPLGTRGVVADGEAQAELAVEAARLRVELAREAVEISVRGAWEDVRAARVGLTAAEARRRASFAAVAVVEARYTAGSALGSELLGARATLADAEYALVGARAQALRAGFLLGWVVGAD